MYQLKDRRLSPLESGHRSLVQLANPPEGCRTYVTNQTRAEVASMGLKVPLSFLLEVGLPTTAKVLWLAETARVHHGLDVRTAAKARAHLTLAGWYANSPIDKALSNEQRVTVSTPLICDPSVRGQAKVIYGVLQALDGYHDWEGAFTYTALSARAQVSLSAVKYAVHDLEKANWITLTPGSQRQPIHFALHNPEALEVAKAAQRLASWEYKNEALMKEYLSLLIDSDEFTENARPGYLVNPQSRELLEFDRYYPPSTGFEYQGEQHFRTTKRFPSEAALSKQQTRDLLKEGLCAQRGIKLVAVTRKDLTLEGMQALIPPNLPRRDLRGLEELIEYLASIKP